MRWCLVLALAFAIGCVPVGTGGGSGGDGGNGGAGGVGGEPSDATPPDADAVVESDAAEPDPDAAEPEPEPDAAEPEPDAEVPPPERVTVATFNVRQFFDTVCDSGQCGFDDFEEQYPPAEFDARAQTVAYGVDRIGADIVLLQEIESQESLDGLLQYLDEQYSVAVIGELGFDASLDVAVLARAGLVRVVRHADERIPRPRGGTTTFARELLEVRLDVNGSSVIVVNAHFKSKSNDDADRRLAEARASRLIVDEIAEDHPDALIVFGGDLNDTPGSAPIDALEEGGGWLRVSEELGDDAATIDFRGRAQAIDHLYFIEAGSGAFVPGTAEVIRDSERGLARSDHAALKATFELP